MRCPKCQYISFDSTERCRNCGYELSLTREDAPVDLSIARDEPGPGLVDEMALSASETRLTGTGPTAGLDRLSSTDLSTGDVYDAPAPDLPLFTDHIADDQAPLVTPPAVPRQPLAVRRATPRPRARGAAASAGPSLDLGPERDSGRLREASEDDSRLSTDRTAGVGRRIGAGLVDAVILLSIQAAVFHLTLRACELGPEDWRVLPLIPLAIFMLLLCGGYFVLFTAAGGQTIGKMAARIRVVALFADEHGILRVSFRAAALRAIACFGSVVLAGSGFLPVLLNADRRAFHDRVAGTRVVLA